MASSFTSVFILKKCQDKNDSENARRGIPERARAERGEQTV
jgi:hypothetical protein